MPASRPPWQREGPADAPKEQAGLEACEFPGCLEDGFLCYRHRLCITHGTDANRMLGRLGIAMSGEWEDKVREVGKWLAGVHALEALRHPKVATG